MFLSGGGGRARVAWARSAVSPLRCCAGATELYAALHDGTIKRSSDG